MSLKYPGFIHSQTVEPEVEDGMLTKGKMTPRRSSVAAGHAMQNPNWRPRERSGGRSEANSFEIPDCGLLGKNQSDGVSRLLGRDVPVVCYLDPHEETISTVAQCGEA